MWESLNKVLDFIILSEGGYVDNKNDPGGETKYGISKRSYPDVDIAGLSESEAREIYTKDYWEKIKGDDIPFPLDMCVMDTAVNAGVSTALRLLHENEDYRSYLLARIDFYIDITKKNKKLLEFFRGWIIRVNYLRRLCEE